MTDRRRDLPRAEHEQMLAPELLEALRRIGSADIVLAVLTYNNAASIGGVIGALRLGQAKYFPNVPVALVVSDGGSTDGTPELIASVHWDSQRVVTRHAAPVAERVAVPYHGIPGRGAAHLALLQAAHELSARACAFIGPDALGIMPDWVDRLLRPVLEDGYDYVSPLYHRHRYEGTLTYGLIYPVMRALYGQRIRHPLGGQTALSGRLVAHLAGGEIKGADVARHGLDLWIAATAMTAPFTVCEAWLGSGKTEARAAPSDLATTVAEVLAAVFAVVEATTDVWAEVQGSEPVPAVGTPFPLDVESVEVNVRRMVRAFRLGVKDLLPLWEQALTPETLSEVLALDAVPDETFAFPHDLWARVVYDFALGYHFRVVYREHLLRSLVPLYLGRTAAFVRQSEGGGTRETEAWIEETCRAFEAQKGYLVARWQ